MRNKAKLWQISGLILALVMLLGSAPAQAKCGPKVDNFVLFVDQSGSMYMTYWKLSGKEVKTIKGKADDTDRLVKEVLAKQLLTDMNSLIPELSYKGALALFAPYQVLQEPVAYNRTALVAGIKAIKDRQDIFGRMTPTAPGFVELEQGALLAKLSGKTAIIMLSDGMANVGGDPVMEAKRLVEKYPNLTIHVISFAQPGVKDMTMGGQGMVAKNEEQGASNNKQIAQLGKGILVEASDLFEKPGAMEKFVTDVFCTEEVPPVAKAEVIKLRGINFDHDKYNIKPEFQPVLDEAVAMLKAKPTIKVEINGHTDSTGTPQYNMGLSERRAKAVYDYFVAKGIAASRLKTVGHGLTDPIATNATAEGRALNRRVELKVMP